MVSLENSEKSLKRGSRGLSAPGLKKLEESRKKVDKTSRKLEKNFKIVILDSFCGFFRPQGRKGPGTPFQTNLDFSEFSRERPF